MLRNEGGVTSHRRLPPVVTGRGRSESLHDEPCGMLHYDFQPAIP